MAKVKICKKCGREIPEGLNICPACGGKAKPPFIIRLLRAIAIVIAVFLVLDFLLGDSNSVPVEDREYAEVTVDQLYEELSDNALKAKDTYTDAYVAVKGKMRVIDSDGTSVAIYPIESESLEGIECVLTSDEQREAVKAHSKGDIVTVKGQITEVDGIFLYKMKVDSIE